MGNCTSELSKIDMDTLKSTAIYVDFNAIETITELNKQEQLYLACRHNLNQSIILKLLSEIKCVTYVKIKETILCCELQGNEPTYIYSKLIKEDANIELILKYNIANSCNNKNKINELRNKVKDSNKNIVCTSGVTDLCAQILANNNYSYEYIKETCIYYTKWDLLKQSVIVHCFHKILLENKHLSAKFKVTVGMLNSLIPLIIDIKCCVHDKSPNYSTRTVGKGNRKRYETYISSYTHYVKPHTPSSIEDYKISYRAMPEHMPKILEQENILLRMYVLSNEINKSDKCGNDELTKLVITCDRIGFINFATYLLNVGNEINEELYNYLTICDNYQSYMYTLSYQNYMISENNKLGNPQNKLTFHQIVENSTQQIDWLNLNIKYKPLLSNIISNYPQCLLLNIGLNDVNLKSFHVIEINKVLNNSEELLCFLLLNEIEFNKTNEINELFFNILQKIENSCVKRTDMYTQSVNYYDVILDLWKKQQYSLF